MLFVVCSRVGQGDCSPFPLYEPCVRVSPHTAQALLRLCWGDSEFTRDFILYFDKEKTAGYYMGFDGYTWGRVYCSSDPAFNGQTENIKHWYNFMLWGRLGYNANLSTDVFKLEGNGILNIVDYCKKVVDKQQISEITPLEVADSLDGYANRTLYLIEGVDASMNTELKKTKNDILAFAHLGN